MEKRKKNGFKIELDKIEYIVYFKTYNERVVSCTLIEENNYDGEDYIFTGMSKCNIEEGDVFDENFGRKESFKKALSKREKFWEKRINFIIKNKDELLVKRVNAIVTKAEKVFKW